MNKFLIVLCMTLGLLSAGKADAQGNLDGLTTEQQVQLVYIGLLGRAADRLGLAYWVDEIDRGVFTIEALRDNIVRSQPEYLNGLGQLPRDQLVASLYQNLFRRQPDAPGLEFWAVGGGATVSIDRLVLALINGAGSTDTAALLNKATAAAYYTANYVNYDRSESIVIVQSVDASSDSLQTAIIFVDSLVISKTLGVFDESRWDEAVYQ